MPGSVAQPLSQEQSTLPTSSSLTPHRASRQIFLLQAIDSYFNLIFKEVTPNCC